jgi:hypothetical protein
MEFDLLVECLIGTALTMGAISLIPDTVVALKRLRHAGRRKAQLAELAAKPAAYPCPIPDGFPVARDLLPNKTAPLNRTDRARAQLRVSGAAMSEMRALLGGVDELPVHRVRIATGIR